MDYVANVIPFFGRNLTRIYFKLTQLTFAGASAPPFSIPFQVCGEGIGKGNFVSLSFACGGLEPIHKVRPDKKP